MSGGPEFTHVEQPFIDQLERAMKSRPPNVCRATIGGQSLMAPRTHRRIGCPLHTCTAEPTDPEPHAAPAPRGDCIATSGAACTGPTAGKCARCRANAVVPTNRPQPSPPAGVGSLRTTRAQSGIQRIGRGIQTVWP